MRSILLIILGSWLSLTARAQFYFNELNALFAGQARLFSVTEFHGKSYSAVEVLDSSHHLSNGAFLGIYGMRFLVRDATGQIIHNKYFESSSANEVVPMAKTIVTRSDSSLLVFCKTSDSGKVVIAVLNFDTVGNLINVKKLPKPSVANFTTENWFPVDAKEDRFGNVIVLTHCLNFLIDGKKGNVLILTKLDQNLDIIWNKLYTDDYHSSFASSLIVDSNTYTFCATLQNTNRFSFDITSQTEIYRVDTSGNSIWYWRSNPDSLEYTFDFIRTNDGGFVYCGVGSGYQKLSQSGTFTTLYFKGWVQKLDSNGKALWNSNLNAEVLESGYYNRQTSIKELPDGSLIVAGSIYGDFAPSDTTWKRSYGLLTKMSPAGKIVWQRKYTSTADSLTYSVEDMTPTIDNGFLLVGSGQDVYPPIIWPSTLKAWTIKVDSYGCTSSNDPNCITVGLPNEQLRQNENYAIVPNPSSGDFQLRYDKQTEQQQTLVVTDMLGRKINEYKLATRSGHVNLNLQNIPPGVYLYRIVEFGMVRSSGKLVKN